MRPVERASDLSRSLLAPELPDRWAHTQRVARQARGLRSLLGEDADLVEAAAWLHDIGYAPALVMTGLHSLDGARYLRESAFDNRPVWTLVAHHSCAVIEAEERGLADVLLSEFPITGDRADYLVTALTYCDMTTGPQGQEMSVDQRISEILDRYDPDDVVHRSNERAAPILREQSASIVAALAEH